MMERDEKISDAATRVRKYLTDFDTLGGVDPEIIHKANYSELRRSDLALILDALGRDR